jgi:TrmH RNA methyltransferase
MTNDELRICGLTAVRAVFARAPESIRRLYFDYATGRDVGAISSYLAQAKKIYRMVEPEELEKVAATVHHGGIVAVVEARSLLPVQPETVAEWAAACAPLILLDRIGNAHNLGAIVRSAAFFGVRRLVLPEHPQQARPSDATYRVAEGGMEHVDLYSVRALPGLITGLRAAGYAVWGLDLAPGAISLVELERRQKPGVPWAWVLGNEEHGLAPDVRAACTGLATIPGAGHVQSLNVAATAAVALWSLTKGARGAANR